MTAIKLCGFTRAADVDLAGDLGVHAVGFVLWPGSPRSVTVPQASALIRRLPALVTPVGVFVDPSVEDVRAVVEQAGIRVVQIHGTRAVDALAGEGWIIVRAASLVGGRVTPAVPDAAMLLLDAHDPQKQGGTGMVVDWLAAAAVARTRRVILAGGLTAANVREAIRTVRPWGVDVASGIEVSPGIKDAGLMRAFVGAARSAADGGAGETSAGGDRE